MHHEFDQLRHELNALKADNAQIAAVAANNEMHIAALSANNAQIAADNAQIKAQFRSAQRRLRIQTGLAFVAVAVALFVSPGNRAALAQGYGVTLASLNTRLQAVEAKTQFQSADATAKSTTFSGCNMIVNDGGGSTASIVTNAAGQGLGNLIIGYNDLNGRSDYNRTGSHNLIVGDRNNYSSYGGIVAGSFNAISGPYAAVSGGFMNSASGNNAAVSGGYANTVSGDIASVSGGSNNIASGRYSSVSGGDTNMATGQQASISGGYGNTASGLLASVSGGNANSASGGTASVSGGANNMAGGDFSSISGGYNLATNAPFGWVGGKYSSP